MAGLLEFYLNPTHDLAMFRSMILRFGLRNTRDIPGTKHIGEHGNTKDLEHLKSSLTTNGKERAFRDFLLTNISTRQTFIKNTFWLLLAEVFNKGFVFLLTVALARHLGASGFGQFSFALGFVGLFVTVADFGINIFATKEIAREKNLASRYVENIVGIKSVLSFITLLLIFVVINLLDQSTETKWIVYLLGIYVVVNSYNDFFVGVYRAHERMEFEFLAKFVQGITLFSLGIYFLTFNYGLRYIAGSYVIATSTASLLTIILIWRRFTRFFVDFDFGLWKIILEGSWPFALSGLFIIVYLKINIVMLGVFKDQTVVGLYSVAANLLILVMFIGNIVNSVLLPTFSRGGVKHHDFKRMLKLICLVSIIVSLVVVLFAPLIVRLLFGIAFTPAVPITRLISFTIIFLMPNTFMGTYFASRNLQKYTLGVTASLACSNVALNLVMIPRYGGAGAAAATVFTEMIGTGLLYKKLRKIL